MNHPFSAAFYDVQAAMQRIDDERDAIGKGMQDAGVCDKVAAVKESSPFIAPHSYVTIVAQKIFHIFSDNHFCVGKFIPSNFVKHLHYYISLN